MTCAIDAQSLGGLTHPAAESVRARSVLISMAAVTGCAFYVAGLDQFIQFLGDLFRVGCRAATTSELKFRHRHTRR